MARFGSLNFHLFITNKSSKAGGRGSYMQEMKLALLVAALKFLGVESVLAVHKEAPPNPDEVPLPAVPNATWISDV